MNREDFPAKTRSLLEHPLRVEWLHGTSVYGDPDWPKQDWRTLVPGTDINEFEHRTGRLIAIGTDRCLVVQDGTDTLTLVYPESLHILE
jgi:hypothetical protein